MMSPDFLGQLVGEGAYSWVYALADHPSKVLKLAKNSRANLAHEAQLLQILEHTNLYPKVHLGQIDLKHSEYLSTFQNGGF
jgi:predicted Ser/Thr protein kinase